MTTLEIETFLAILRYGNFTEAAKSLYISQSTLSHRLVELEKKVGVKLIYRERGGKNLVLTNYGKQFLLIAKRWETLMQDTEQIRLQPDSLSLTIGAVDTFHNFILPPLFQALGEHTPQINLNLKTYNSAELYMHVDRGEMDVGFTLLDLPMKNILVEKIYSEGRVILRKEDAPNRADATIHLKDLDPKKEIFFVGDTAFHAWYQRWKRGTGYPPLQVDTTQLLLLLLNQTDSWSLVPMCVAQYLSTIGTYAYYHLENPPPERVCYKIQSKHPTPASAQSIEILNSYLGKILNLDL